MVHAMQCTQRDNIVVQGTVCRERGREEGQWVNRPRSALTGSQPKPTGCSRCA